MRRSIGCRILRRRGRASQMSQDLGRKALPSQIREQGHLLGSWGEQRADHSPSAPHR